MRPRVGAGRQAFRQAGIWQAFGHVRTDLGVAVDVLAARPAQRHHVEHGDVVPHHGRLANDDARPVVDEDPLPDARRGVDVDLFVGVCVSASSGGGAGGGVIRMEWTWKRTGRARAAIAIAMAGRQAGRQAGRPASSSAVTT